MKTQPQSTEITAVNSGDLSSLQEKTGMVQGFLVKRSTSKAAGKGLKAIEEAKVQAEVNIALTTIAVTESAIRTTLVGNAMGQFGALATRLNAATTSVDQALTNASAAETVTHLSNRAANINLAQELQRNSKVTEEEANVVISFARADAADDIQRSRRRMTEAKDAVSSLHEFGLKVVVDAKSSLS